MDHAAWLERLKHFVAAWQARLPAERRPECYVRSDPPLTAGQMDELREDLDLPLPASVVGFLTRATSRLIFECICTPPGHPEVRAAGQLFDYWIGSPEARDYDDQFSGPLEGLPFARIEAEGATDHMQECGCALDRAWWRFALPLTFMPSTDAPLALWVYDPDLAEPPVVSLYYAEPGFLLANTFDEFLTHWEALGYDWGQEYLEEGQGLSGVMDPLGPAGRARRALLGLEAGKTPG